LQHNNPKNNFNFNAARDFRMGFNFMPAKKYRKLHLNLPRQPLVDQGPWMIAGVLLAVLFLLVVVCAYFHLIG
jgi:hypothetical protein